uniref:Uncharacterized protein n=1 Tax=Romanomermis culicivorax TaxID=13658 RepID=A0A915JYC6_ROMCU
MRTTGPQTCSFLKKRKKYENGLEVRGARWSHLFLASDLVKISWIKWQRWLLKTSSFSNIKSHKKQYKSNFNIESIKLKSGFCCDCCNVEL